MNYIYLLIEYLKQWLASDDILYKLLAILIILFVLFGLSTLYAFKLTESDFASFLCYLHKSRLMCEKLSTSVLITFMGINESFSMVIDTIS